MLKKLFNPASVALIGATDKEGKVGNVLLKNLLSSFQGKIFPINPKKASIYEIPCYPSVKDVPERIDLAIIAVPAKAVPDVLKDCGVKGIPFVIIITAGFRETGEDGYILEQRLIEIAKNYNIRVVGPNCLGVINTINPLNATFGPDMPPSGRASIFSQSGAVGIALIDWAIENNFGIGKFVSFGNKADLNECDFIEYFGEDEETDLILGYIEDIKDGKRFMQVAEKVARKKPLIILKAGFTQAGAKAASSHTGALAGSETAVSAAFKQTGIIRVFNIQDLFETAEIFKTPYLPESENLLIITNAGGPGIIAADTADTFSLKLPPLEKELLDKLSEKLPSAASLYNPIDILGDATSERYKIALEVATKSKLIQGICVVATVQATTDIENIANLITEFKKIYKKPLFAAFVGGKRVKKAAQILKNNGIPCFFDSGIAVKSYSKLVSFCKRKNLLEESYPQLDIPEENREKARLILETLESIGVSFIGEDNSRKILSLYGFRFPEGRVVKTEDEAVQVAEEIGYPVVLKVVSPQIVHKSDVGGIKLNLKNEEEVRKAFREITASVRKIFPKAFIKGIYVCRMIKEGKEVIFGVTRDKVFGHLIMFGLGGIYVEALKDVSFRVIPIKRRDAEEMIEEIKGKKILEGLRGEKPCDKEILIYNLLALSRLVQDFPQIKEIDINPFKVQEIGGYALDARIII